MNPFFQPTANIQAWPTPMMFVGGPGSGSGPGSSDLERDTESGGQLTRDTESNARIHVTDFVP